MLYQLNCFYGEGQYMTTQVEGTYPKARAEACRWISHNKYGEYVKIYPYKGRVEEIFRFNQGNLKGKYGSEYYIDRKTKRISLVDYRTGRLGKTVETWEP